MYRKKIKTKRTIERTMRKVGFDHATQRQHGRDKLLRSGGNPNKYIYQCQLGGGFALIQPRNLAGLLPVASITSDVRHLDCGEQKRVCTD